MTNSQNTQLSGCLIMDKRGRLLLLHRNTSENLQWEISGGKVENEEEASITARREAKEELGIDVEVKELLGVKSFQENGSSFEYSWYLGKVLNGIPTPNEDKFDDVKFFTWDQLNQMRDQLSNNTKNLLDAYLSGELKLPESSS